MAPVLPSEVSRALDGRVLNLILLPTEQCNFRCFYCYEDFAQGQMPTAVVAGVKNLLAARAPDLRALEISWFGGEPLLARKVIDDLSGFILGLVRRHPHLGYSANITTNGYLLDPAALAQLVAYGITEYQISLDGPPEVHDRTRVTRRGDGSFERIWRNLLGIRRSTFEVEVIVRVHYQHESFTQLAPLIDMINRELVGDDRFRIYFKAVNPLGGPNNDRIHRFSEAEQSAIEAALRGMLDDPRQEFEGGLNDDHYVCYAGAANSFVIRSNGDVNKCTVALNSATNRIGRLNADGGLDIDQDKYRRWVGVLFSGDRRVMACPYPHVVGLG